MAHAFIELHSGSVGSPESANDNNGIKDTRHGRTDPESPDNPFPSVIVTGDDMVITRDPISGDWIVEDYEARLCSSRCRGRVPSMRSGKPQPSMCRPTSLGSRRVGPLPDQQAFSADNRTKPPWSGRDGRGCRRACNNLRRILVPWSQARPLVKTVSDRSATGPLSHCGGRHSSFPYQR